MYLPLRVVVSTEMLWLCAALCFAQTFQLAPSIEAKRPSVAQGGYNARATPSLGWGSGLEVAQQARAAQAALAAGDYAGASSHAERAAKAAPQNPDLCFLLGYAARLGGYYPASANAYQRGLAVRPGSVQGLAGLAQTYAKMHSRVAGRGAWV